MGAGGTGQAQRERVEAGRAAAQELLNRAAAAVEVAEDDVQAARELLVTARAAGAGAATRLREAGRTAAKAWARAEAAARKLEKLTSSEG
ncbi:hypothetical protein Snoj_29800 [Streptomyces nojiriensis]|uniref:Uncharacterized protein n=1 Tax=Streptomyces nojiriensis TaxID=66374 RepID=A0ABQ3SM58_9ACTN|nr:hypothetical protein [Streptomyces nojiriensis]QTI42647.1 hypothetical protein JYK04_00406 [Streptomyces nojiriensis]GGS15833.1 hypothetical protein GCM10010205_51980 [Streptomyces nojiriensis]GHI69062.1 hypothetical protein Snoj_29800 [Streptomyces nojiriensis]